MIFFYRYISYGLHGGSEVSTAASQQEGWLSVWSLHLPVLGWIYSRYYSFVPQYKNMNVSLISEYKLPMGMSVSVCSCLYVALQ